MIRHDIRFTGTFLFSSIVLLLMWLSVLFRALRLYPIVFLKTCRALLLRMSGGAYGSAESLLFLIVFLLLILSLVFAGFKVFTFFISSLHLSRKKRVSNVRLSSLLCRLTTTYRLSRIEILIVEQDDLAAYSTGFFRPRIFLTSSLVSCASSRQLEAIILHELYHVRHHHVFWMFFLRVTTAFLFFIPLLHSFFRRLLHEFELAADAFVVQQQGTDIYLSRSLALHLTHTNRMFPSFSSFLAVRVDALLGRSITRETPGRIRFCISALSIGMMVWLSFPRSSSLSISDTQLARTTCARFSCETDCFPPHDGVDPPFSPKFSG